MDAAEDGGPSHDHDQDLTRTYIQDSPGVIVGDHATQHNYFHGPGRIGRTAYLEQVRDIAPAELHDRAQELKELADFCHGDEPYVWLQAGPWAGKSALASWFVLHPPDGMDVACFFITGRLAAQADSIAFTEALLEQLASLLDEQLPASAALMARDAHRRQVLREAARRAHENERQLVLVIDGLDEDRSRRLDGAMGEGLPSIASLLPRHRINGLRVIVTGRPDPEIPDDVPGDHPLRHCTIRRLGRSAYASDIERLAKEELRRLVNGSEAERSILGLVTAAQGGLTHRDLEDLTGLAPHEIGELLSGVAGRTFTRRASRWTPGSGSEVYLLGHEELQRASTADLGKNRLDVFRDRLHAWAKIWQGRNWPPETPEYLLSGYFHLLEDLGDLPRMTECALDLARHDRMLGVTGGDAAAITEVRTALESIAAQNAPDVGAALALACHRDQLARRNAHIPVRLPAVWIALGHLPRAEALAASITDADGRAEALVQVAEALAAMGQHEQAIATASQAKAAAGLMAAASAQRMAILARLALVLAAAGQLEQAVAIAQSIPDSSRRTQTLTRLAETLAAASQHEQAIAIAHSIPDSSRRAETLTHLAETLAAASQHEQAIAIAHSIPDFSKKPAALARVAVQLAAAGQHEQAIAIAQHVNHYYASFDSITSAPLSQIAAGLAAAGQHEQAIMVTQYITDFYQRAEALMKVAVGLATAGQHERAITVAQSLEDPSMQADALARLTKALAETGDHQQAAETAALAKTAAELITDPDWWEETVLAEIAVMLTVAGQREHAITVVWLLENHSKQGETLARLVEALAEAGDHQQAAETAALAEIAAEYIIPLEERAEALTRISKALAAGGDHDQAITVAELLEDLSTQAETLVEVVEVLAATGHQEGAAEAAAQAEATTEYDIDEEIMIRVAEALASVGQYERAIVVAQNITDSVYRASALANVAVTVAARHRESAASTIQAEAVARLIADPYEQSATLIRVAEALAAAGQHKWATAIAYSLTDPDRRAAALVEVAMALAKSGQHEQAAAAASQAETAARSITALDPGADVLAQVAMTLARSSKQEQDALTRGPGRSNGVPDSKAESLAQAAMALASSGNYEQAAAAADRAETTARSITNAHLRAKALAQVAEAMAAAEQHQQAIAVARSITDLDLQASALARVAGTMAAAGHYDKAAVTARRAETAARSITDPFRRSSALARVTKTMAAAGQREQAAAAAAASAAAAHSVPYAVERAKALVQVAVALDAAGLHTPSAAAVAQSEAVARSVRDPLNRTEVLASISEALARAGYAQSASRLAATACVLGPWTTAIRPVLLLDPSARTLVKAVLETR